MAGLLNGAAGWTDRYRPQGVPRRQCGGEHCNDHDGHREEQRADSHIDARLLRLGQRKHPGDCRVQDGGRQERHAREVKAVVRHRVSRVKQERRDADVNGDGRERAEPAVELEVGHGRCKLASRRPPRGGAGWVGAGWVGVSQCAAIRWRGGSRTWRLPIERAGSPRPSDDTGMQW